MRLKIRLTVVSLVGRGPSQGPLAPAILPPPRHAWFYILWPCRWQSRVTSIIFHSSFSQFLAVLDPSFHPVSALLQPWSDSLPPPSLRTIRTSPKAVRPCRTMSFSRQTHAPTQAPGPMPLTSILRSSYPPWMLPPKVPSLLPSPGTARRCCRRGCHTGSRRPCPIIPLGAPICPPPPAPIVRAAPAAAGSAVPVATCRLHTPAMTPCCKFRTTGDARRPSLAATNPCPRRRSTTPIRNPL